MMTPEKSPDTVFIRNLTLEMSAGIYEFEKLTKQRVMVNLTLYVESNREKTPGSIDEVVSYENIANKISEIAISKHYDLLEEFVEIVAAECLKDRRILTVQISAEKPDILPAAESVGVGITRNRRDFTPLV